MANTSTTELDLLKSVTTSGGATDDLHVVVDSGSITVTGGSVTVGGKTSVQLVRNDYTMTSVTTAAYVQLVASLPGAVTAVYIFDSSGQTLVLSTGGAGSEVDQIYIVPGGNDLVPLTIASGTRVAVKAISATASIGELNISFLQ